MTLELLFLHIFFILACAGGSFFYGWLNGKKDVINMFIDDELVTIEQLKEICGLRIKLCLYN